MTPEENELRRALEARSGAPTSEFRSRLSRSLQVRRAAPNLMPAIAFATVIVLTATSVGVLIASRHFGRTPGPVASGARTVSPTVNPNPITTATSLQLSAPSTNVVWALVNYDHLYRSTDQGSHWEQRPVPTGRAITFIDDHEGWLLTPAGAPPQCDTAPAVIWHTSDGGTSWHLLTDTGIATAQCKESIWFVDPKDGFVSAWDPNHRPKIYRTSDGGTTWAPSTLPDPPDFKTQAGGFVLRADWVTPFAPVLYLLAWGKQGAGSPYPDVPDRQYVFTSTDGGATWKWLEKTTSRSIVMVTESRWLDLVAPGRSSETVNGGQQFHQYASDFNSDAPGSSRFAFADAQVGYASGGGRLQRTLDGGLHWTRLETPGVAASAKPSPVPPSPIPMPSSAELSAPNANVVWALLGDQYLFRSVDQGKTWDQSGPMPATGTPLISFADDTTGWALYPGAAASDCSQQGIQLYRTTDGAATWKLVSIAQYGQVSPNGFGIELCKRAMYFADALHGWVGVGNSTTDYVYRTSDGGVTWSATQLPYPPGFNPANGFLMLKASIKSFGSTVLAYAPPYVFQSLDGGVTWKYLVQAPDSPIVQLNFLTPTHWLKVQSNLETADAGATWQTFATDYQDAAPVASDFVFGDDKVGYGTVRGDLHRTVDGGAHWELIKTAWP